MSDSNTDLQDFANMSAALTGFTPGFIRPALDPVNLTQAYFDFATARTAGKPATVQTLLAAYRAIASQPPQAVADRLLETASKSPSANALLAQSIVLMWYFGSWYEPPATTGGTPSPNEPQQPAAAQVVSSLAYTHGLAWNVAQAHPMGYSELAFGYWKTPPGPLSQFGVQTTGGGTK